MSSILLLLSLLSQPTSAEKPPSTGLGTCAIEGWQEKFSEKVRPSPMIACSYGVAEFKRRLLSIFRWPTQRLNIETLEQTFLLPRLKTSFDQPREAAFTAYASGLDSNAKWSARLDFNESFTPTDAWRRPRFRGSERPVLINPRIRGDRVANVAILSDRKTHLQPLVCFKEGEFWNVARQAGWREPLIRSPDLVTDGGVAPPSVVYERGRWRVEIEFDRENKCADSVRYSTSADPSAN